MIKKFITISNVGRFSDYGTKGDVQFSKLTVILSIAQCAKQVVVFSRDHNFLRRLWDKVAPGDRKSLCVRRSGRTESTMEEWDIVTATRSEYLHDYFALVDYLNNGSNDLIGIARKIRPLIEENLRMRFPDIFGSNKWLGEFLDLIRNAVAGDATHGMKSQLTELESLNDFSKGYHHGGTPGPAKEVLDDISLQSYVKRTLIVLRGTA
jgi:hypothetical protein